MKLLRKLGAALAFGATLAVGVVSASNIALFGGPGQSNPINQPQILGDVNTLINAINTALAPLGLGQINTAQNTFGPSGRVFSLAGPINDLATSQGVTIATYTIPFNSFDATGRTLRMVADWHSAANFDVKFAGCGYATKLLTAKVAATDNSGIGHCRLQITQGITANTVQVSGMLYWAGATTVTYNTVLPGTITNSTTQSTAVYFAESSPTTAGDVILDNFEVFYDN